MSEFQKEANLTFRYGESLTATAESRMTENASFGSLTAGVSTLETDYQPGGRVTFILTVVNRTRKTLPLFTLSDNLGSYAFAGKGHESILSPLDLAEQARYFYNGMPMGVVRAVLSESGVEFPLPALPVGSAAVIYTAAVNQYASPAADGAVQSVITWDDPLTGEPMRAVHRLPVRRRPEVILKKQVGFSLGEGEKHFFIRYTISNSGNETAVKAQLTDQLPIGASLKAVALRGIPVPEQFFQYENGLFTLPVIGRLDAPLLPSQDAKQGFLAIPAASVKRDISGAFISQPGEVEIILEGSLGA